MFPSPQCLDLALRFFFGERANNTEDPLELDDLAFVQFPQRFHNTARGLDFMHAGNELMFDGKMINQGNVGLVPFAGTNAVWRTDVLFALGGIQYGSLTEDANTSYVAH